MKYKDLPKDIRELAELRAKEELKMPDDETKLCSVVTSFRWQYTTEGHEFWDKINDGNFSVYHELYPNHEWRQPQFTKGEIVEVSNYANGWLKREFYGIAEKCEVKYACYNESYTGIAVWPYCRKLQHEYTIDEARAIIAESKGIELEKITIK